MGTSINQRSPRTVGWSVVAAAYAREDVPTDRLVQEIWRAAANQPSGDLAKDLEAPLITEIARIASTGGSRAEAVDRAARTAAFSGRNSLAADLAQRALAQSFGEQGDRVAAFTRSLFSQAGDYLVSRDLPGYVGEQARARNVSDAIALKREIRAEIGRRVDGVRRPKDLSAVEAWQGYVARVVRHLQGVE